MNEHRDCSYNYLPAQEGLRDHEDQCKLLMEAQKFIIRFGCNDFVFEGSILELADVVRTLEKLTPALLDLGNTRFRETMLQKRLRIFSARKEVEADPNNTIYVLDI